MIVVWVYGYEGNEWIVQFINPLRLITSRLPVHITSSLAFLLTFPLFLYVKLFNHKKPYMKQLKSFKFNHIQLIILDQLLPKIANYWRKKEVISLFQNLPIKNVKLTHVNSNSWTILATKA